jgi:hypothetical protein
VGADVFGDGVAHDRSWFTALAVSDVVDLLAQRAGEPDLTPRGFGSGLGIWVQCGAADALEEFAADGCGVFPSGWNGSQGNWHVSAPRRFLRVAIPAG